MIRRLKKRSKVFAENTKWMSSFEKISLANGDRIRFTENAKRRGQKFLNNDLRTVVGNGDVKIIFDKGEIIRNGTALHLDQGIAVTSHASQAKTVDQVIVSVPVRAFSQANEAQFYDCQSQIDPGGRSDSKHDLAETTLIVWIATKSPGRRAPCA